MLMPLKITDVRKDQPLKIIILYRLHITNDNKQVKIKILNDLLNVCDKTKRATGDKYEWRIFIICDGDNLAEENVNLVKNILPKYGKIIVGNFKDKAKDYPVSVYRYSADFVRCVVQIDIIKEQHCNSSDIIFFMEDDYAYNNKSIEKTINFASKYKNDFISMYDHPNYYSHSSQCFLTYTLADERKMASQFPMAILATYVIYEFDHHWRTVISTCYAFACSYNALEMLDKTYKEISILAQVGFMMDHDFWRYIWDRGLQRLWTPIPGLAVHLGENNGYLPLKS